MAAAAPHRIEIVPWGYYKAVSGTWSRQQSSSYLGAGILQSPNSNGAYVEWEVLLDAGTWALDAIYRSRADGGKSDITLGGAAVVTIECYSAGTLNNVVSTTTGITVASTGYYALRATTNGKHASSTGYFVSYNLLVLRRTGA